MEKICIENGHGASVAASVSAVTKSPGDTRDDASASHVMPYANIVNCGGKDADGGCFPVPVAGKPRETCVDDIVATNHVLLTPRLEMRLALKHAIMTDDDFEPGPANVAVILNRDLSSYHRFTGRDLISRTASRVVPKEAAHISFSQQKNSKMDTPTPNRRKSNQNTWNSSVSVAASE